ncbi:Xaa-Pro aminopeptidase [Bacillus sp. TS-2]|nr:Xaa-Pro aminopeptidase [Bacillus sp. TS-2]
MNFELIEYMERLKKTKERMAYRGIEVLLVTDPANMNYLTGYDGWSFYVDQLLIVIDDEEQPIWIGRTADANGAKVTTWLYHENIISYPDKYVQSQTRHPMEFVAEILTQIGQDKRSIGVEMDNYYFSAKCYQTLCNGLPNAHFHDATLLVNWVRIIKSNHEIALMKKAGKIARNAMLEGIDAVNEGVRGCDVAARISYAQLKGTSQYGGDYPAIVPLLPSGERTSTPHLTWTDAPYNKGETVILEIAGCYQRYHAPLARTVHVGQPTISMKNLSEVVIEGLNTCIEFIKPGVTCEEIEEVWRNTVEKYGVFKESRLGYSMGLNYPPDWGEHTASIRKGDKTVILPNMTFHLIPAIWSEGDSFEISESLRITSTGCEPLVTLPRELVVKDDSTFKNLDPVG